MNKLVDKVLDNPVAYAIAAAAVVGVLYFIARRTASEAASAAGGLVSGNNAVTEGTPYQGKGVVGTVAAATNAASGGVLQDLGESIGSWLYDVTHAEYDPNAPATVKRPANVVADGANATDALWGPLGLVDLRTSRK